MVDPARDVLDFHIRVVLSAKKATEDIRDGGGIANVLILLIRHAS